VRARVLEKLQAQAVDAEYEPTMGDEVNIIFSLPIGIFGSIAAS